MLSIQRRVTCLILTTLISICAGCASGPQVRERYFWPPPPDTPKIEWLGAYQGQADLKKPGLMELVVGEADGVVLGKPTFIAADGNGKVYVSDFMLKTIVVFDMNTKEVHALGANGLFEQPTGVAVDGQGNIHVADLKTRKVLVFDRDERPLYAIDLSNNVKSIGSIAIDKLRKRLIVPDIKGNQVVVYDLASKVVLFTLGGDATEQGAEKVSFNFPTAVTVDGAGNILVCDSMNASIARFTPDGKFISRFGKRGDGVGDFNMIRALSVDSEGHIYVTDSKANRISIYNEKGEVLLVFGGTYSLRGAGSEITPGGFLLPNGIFIDQNDTIYIVDQYNSRFQVFQYVTDKYLKEHPITKLMPAAKPVAPVKPGIPADANKK